MMARNVEYDQYYTVRFPSERRPLEQLRASFAGIGASGEASSDVASSERRMRRLEEILAEKVFARTRRCPDLHADVSRPEIVAELSRYYEQFGISSGEHQTEQLVRDFEQRVAAQAKHVEF